MGMLMCLIPNGDQKEQHDKISSFNYHHFSDYIKNLEWAFKVSQYLPFFRQTHMNVKQKHIATNKNKFWPAVQVNIC